MRKGNEIIDMLKVHEYMMNLKRGFIENPNSGVSDMKLSTFMHSDHSLT